MLFRQLWGRMGRNMLLIWKHPSGNPERLTIISKHVLYETASERVGVTGCSQIKPLSYALPVGVVI